MDFKWTDVISDERFDSLPAEKKASIRDNYFNTQLLPKAEADGINIDELRAEFNSRYNYVQEAHVESGTNVATTQQNASESVSEASTAMLGFSPDGTFDASSEHWKGKTAGEIYREMSGRSDLGISATQPESQGVSGMTENVDQKIDAETWIDKRAKELLSKNKEITVKEAEIKAENDYQGETAELAADVALGVAIPGSFVKSLPRAAATGAAMTTATGLVKDVVAEDETTVNKLIDRAATGAAFGAAGKKASDVIVKGVEVGAKKFGETGKKISEAISKKKALESNKSIEELDKLNTKYNDIVEGALEKKKEGLKGLEKASAKLTTSDKNALSNIEIADGITVRDFEVAINLAEDVSDLSRKGAKVGSKTVAKEVKNEKLSKLIDDASAPIEKLAKKVTGTKGNELRELAAELIGLRDTGLNRARNKAVKNLTTELNKDLSKITKDIKNDPMLNETQASELVKVVKMLRENASTVNRGDFVKSSELSEGIEKALKDLNIEEPIITKLFDYNRSLKTARKLGEDSVESIDSVAKQFAPAAIIGYLTDAATGGGAFGARFLINTKLNTSTAKRLADVEKAIKGQYKLDEKARQMIQDGADLSSVVSYLAIKKMLKDGE